MLVNSSELEYFVEVYKTRHISKAAIRLGITQPSLTQSLQKLESKLNSKLFHRTKQGVVPTGQGTLFYRDSHILMENWNEIHRKISQSSFEIVGRFKVGCHQSVGAYTLPKLLKNLEETPGIAIELVHDFSRKITESIISFNLDIGFVVNPIRHPDLVLKKLGEDQVCFWRKKGADTLPKRIFADLNLIQIQNLLEKTQFEEFKGWDLISTNSLELIRTLTLSGSGIGMLPKRVAWAENSDLIPYDEKLPFFEDKIFLAYRKDVMTTKAGREMIRLASFSLE